MTIGEYLPRMRRAIDTAPQSAVFAMVRDWELIQHSPFHTPDEIESLRSHALARLARDEVRLNP